MLPPLRLLPGMTCPCEAGHRNKTPSSSAKPVTVSAFDIKSRRLGIGVGQNRRPLGGRPKRMMDVTVALMALVLASPVMLVIAILIWATDGAPAIFSHTLVGFDGKPFACYKFR